MKWTAVVLVAAIVAAGLLGAASAGATFPGRSGELMYSSLDLSGKAMYTSSGIDAFDAATKRYRSAFSCFWDNFGHDCTTGEAAVGPDGERVAIVVADTTSGLSGVRYRLALVTPSGEEVGSLPLDEPASDPAWSPDGGTLLVTSYAGSTGSRRSGAPRLVAIDVDGGGSSTVVGDGAADADWSAAGDIAYVRDGDLWTTRLGGPELRLTTAGGASPSWSPDGRRLAFVREGTVWTTTADGGEHQISERSAGAPAWSPDGRHIAFVSPGALGASSYGGIWVMAVDGGCPQAIRKSVGYSSYGSPFWRPVAGTGSAEGSGDRCLIGAPFVDLRTARSRVRVRRTNFRYRFRAEPGARGRATFRTRRKVLVWTHEGQRRRNIAIASPRFEVGPRGVVVLRMRVPYRYRQVLRRDRRFALRVSIALRDRTGQSIAARKRLTLLAPRVRRR